MTYVIPSPCHILSLFLMPIVQCIVAQWRYISSESAVSYSCYIHVRINHELDGIFLLVIISVTGNLCNKCPKWLVEQNSSYSDYFNAISGLYRTAEPQEAL